MVVMVQIGVFYIFAIEFDGILPTGLYHQTADPGRKRILINAIFGKAGIFAGTKRGSNKNDRIIRLLPRFITDVAAPLSQSYIHFTCHRTQ